MSCRKYSINRKFTPEEHGESVKVFILFRKQLMTNRNMYKVLVPYMDNALNIDTPNIFKSIKFY